MKRKIIIIILIINNLYGASELEGINYLNRIRDNVGLNTLKENKQLWKSAKNHTNYIKMNKIEITHTQNSNNLLYSGKHPWDRAEYVGYNNKIVSENISGGITDYKSSIDLLMTAIYHRIGFLNFNINEIGYYKNEDVITYNMGNSLIRQVCAQKGDFKVNFCNETNVINKDNIKFLKEIEKNNPQYIIYPGEESVNILPAFYDEIPNPIPDRIVTGNPISIQFNESKVKEVKIKSFKIYENDIEIENVRILKKENDPNKKLSEYEFVLFPLNRLKWGKRYTVEFKGIVDNKYFEKKWDFYTKRLNGEIHLIKNEKEKEFWRNKDYYLYFEPEIFGRINNFYTNCKEIEFIDYNTLKIKLKNSCMLNIKNKSFNFKIK